MADRSHTSPSLTSNSPLDKRVKGMLVSDTLHLVGVRSSSVKFENIFSLDVDSIVLMEHQHSNRYRDVDPLREEQHEDKQTRTSGSGLPRPVMLGRDKL